MKRPLYTWSVFALCFALLVAAMAWVSITALRLDGQQQRAAQQAELEERSRLALWRMDAALAGLIVEESARPWQAYDAFAPAERAYTKTFTAIREGEVLVPSRLLTYRPTNVLIHFQFGSDGKLTSPQVPTGAERELAISSYTTPERIQEDEKRLAELDRLLNEHTAPGQLPARSPWSLLSTPSRITIPKLPIRPINRDLLASTCIWTATNALQNPALGNTLVFTNSRLDLQSQVLRNNVEQTARANARAQQMQNGANIAPEAAGNLRNPMMEGPLVATWAGPALFLARRVNGDGKSLIQAAWVDWPHLREMLVASIRDLLPNADLQPTGNAPTDDSRRLASLPARLVPGMLAVEPPPSWSPVRITMATAWAAVLLAGIAVAALFHGALSLSERRGAFVSAVTHELRTPLTTFKMYSEMLASGMVRDEAKQQSYLETLQLEANRLAHLVENVLAYARLERGSARSRVERITLGSLLERTRERLQQRAERAGMALVVDSDPISAATTVHVDVAAVEQILFNLVDNACKYAGTSAEKTIHLEALPNGKFAMLRVRDHGHGISADEARRLFKAFNKSAVEAAHSAPGIGLGLALCRRLSRSVGGDLRLNQAITPGACFELLLPLGPAAGMALDSI